jgi:hypothetical protein
MDKPTTPDGQNASPWPEESGSEQGFGATGVFRVVQDVKKPEPAPGPGTESYFKEYRAPEAPKPLPPPLAEPVVHKVVLGAGAESSSELLDRMRLASAERTPVVEKAPAPPAPGGQGSGGFTALLRTLENEPAPPAAALKETPAPPAQSSGFTSLLRTLDTQETAATPAAEPVKTAPPPAQFARPIPEEPVRPPAASSPGGFTELLRTTGGDFETSAPPMQRPGPGDAPAFGGAAGAIPAPPENKPGAFTQLFSSFGGETSAPAPAANERVPGESSRGNAGSFTRMLSLEPQLAPQLPAADPSFREERKPLPGSVDYGNTPGMGTPAAVNRDPFAPAPVVESKPADSAPPGGSVGITRLIQMLDEPTKPAAPRMEAVPASPSPSQEPGPGAWTQTFAALSTPSAPAAPPAASTPAWPPPPIPSQPMPAAPAGASGPSEFTRILDASRMRELAMKGGSGGANLPQAPPPQAPAPPPPAAMPSYQVPPPPPMGGMGAMPHPSAYPPQPPPAPAYPMSYGPPAGAPAPGMYAPAPPPMPAAPPPPAVKPPEPGAGKIQQLVPMLLVVVIVLLVVLIVTVIFLMKH